MTAEPPAFHEYLAADESPVTVESGALEEGGARTATAICVTDRRILFVTEGGGFVDVPRGAVRSIRSRPQRRHSDRELGALVLSVGGGGLAVVAAGALLVGLGGPAALALALVVAGGIAAAAALGRVDVALERAHVAAATDRVDGAVREIDALDGVAVHRRIGERAAAAVDGRPVLSRGALLLAALGVAGLVALGAWTAIALTLGVLCGVAAAGYGAWYVRELEARGERVHRERDVSLRLADGSTVRFRIDDDATLDRELSRLTATESARALPADGVATERRTAEPGASSGP